MENNSIVTTGVKGMENRGPRLLSDLGGLAQGTLKEFLETLSDPVLLIGPGVGLSRGPGSEGSGADETETLPEGMSSNVNPIIVIPVAKQFSTTVADIIWVGRAVTCDVVVAHETVSKVHTVLSRNGAGELMVTDVGSKNGTWVNGRKLQGGEQVVLNDNDVLKLGELETLFLNPTSLYGFLRK